VVFDRDSKFYAEVVTFLKATGLKARQTSPILAISLDGQFLAYLSVEDSLTIGHIIRISGGLAVKTFKLPLEVCGYANLVGLQVGGFCSI
jgi:hypothetical protein